MNAPTHIKVIITASVMMIIATLVPGIASAADNFTRLVDGNDDSYLPTISDDGNLVAFHTFARNVPNNPTAAARSNVFLFDDSDDSYTLVSDNAGDSLNAQISANGEFIVYQSYSTQGLPSTNGFSDIFRYDVDAGTTQLVSNGLPAGEYYQPRTSADGRWVVFAGAPCCQSGTANVTGTFDVYLKDMNAPGTAAIELTSGGNGDSWFPSISDDGSLIVFTSTAGNLGAASGAATTVPAVWTFAPGSSTFTKIADDAARADLAGGGGHIVFQKASGLNITTIRHTIAGGAEIDVTGGNSETVTADVDNPFNFSADRKLRSPGPRISADGAVITFDSTNPNLAPNDIAGRDVFIWSGSRILLTRGNSDSFHATVSSNGGHVAFRSDATNFVTAPDSNDFRDIFFLPRPSATPEVNDPNATTSTTAGPTTTATSTTLPPAGPVAQCTIDSPSAAFRATVDSGDTPASVWRLYQAFFLRQPDQAGYDYWNGQAGSGLPLTNIASLFAASAEFDLRYGSLNDVQFVTLVYNNVLCRTPDQAGYDYWTGLMADGLSRGDLMVYFSDSLEYRIKTDTN